MNRREASTFAAAMLAVPQIGNRLIAIGSEPMIVTPQETDSSVRRGYERWPPVVRIAANG